MKIKNEIRHIDSIIELINNRLLFRKRASGVESKWLINYYNAELKKLRLFREFVYKAGSSLDECVAIEQSHKSLVVISKRRTSIWQRYIKMVGVTTNGRRYVVSFDRKKIFKIYLSGRRLTLHFEAEYKIDDLQVVDN